MNPPVSPQTVVGRQAEKRLLATALASPDPELIAIYGRRRVGKTFLVRQFLSQNLSFELTGLHAEPLVRQLENFSNALRLSTNSTLNLRPRSWLEAFEFLKAHVIEQAKRQRGKQVLFFDELPWLATRRSGFMAALESFWNVFASRRTDVMLIVCGSAASWMIDKVIGSKGGLHNRTTGRIRLEPFNLLETKQYLEQRHIALDHYQIAQLSMALGGIPQYLKQIEPGQSVAQNLDRLCFTKDGLLSDEYRFLYAALFENYELHEAIVRALSAHGRSLTRDQLIERAALKSGGSLSRTLRELVESGFVREEPPYGNHVKQTRYRLSDEYSLFYLNWIETNRTSGAGVWLRKAASRKYSTWSGYAFESLCLKHIPQIKRALGIQGVETDESTWFYQPRNKDEEGAQIDLVIDRRDHCSNLCELKYSEHPFVVDKAYSAELERKRRVFQQRTGTRHTLFLTLITATGLKTNDYSQRLVSNHISLDDLYADCR